MQARASDRRRARGKRRDLTQPEPDVEDAQEGQGRAERRRRGAGGRRPGAGSGRRDRRKDTWMNR